MSRGEEKWSKRCFDADLNYCDIYHVTNNTLHLLWSGKILYLNWLFFLICIYVSITKKRIFKTTDPSTSYLHFKIIFITFYLGPFARTYIFLHFTWRVQLSVVLYPSQTESFRMSSLKIGFSQLKEFLWVGTWYRELFFMHSTFFSRVTRVTRS